MGTRLPAETVSRAVWERLRYGAPAAHVLATFDHVCYLATPEGDVVALVGGRVGDGPLNVVVDGPSSPFAGIQPGTAASLTKDAIHVGDLEVTLRGAAVWDPRPDWDSLRAHGALANARLPTLRALGLQRAPSDSLFALSEGIVTNRPSHRPIRDAFVQGARALRAGWTCDVAQLQEGAIGLAGLGRGLTPSGDDFLTGLMLWAWMAHAKPQSVCRALVDAAADRTTTLSAAFLRAAAQGECMAAWHRLLFALTRGTDEELAVAAGRVLAHGATSGADTLAGFLWVGPRQAASPSGTEAT